MIKLRNIPNIFTGEGRVDKDVSFDSCQSLAGYLSDTDLTDQRVIVNGKVITDFTVKLSDGDEIIVTPKIEGPIIGLIKAVEWVLAWEGIYGVSVATWLTVAAIGYSVYKYVTAADPRKPVRPEPTYGWDGIKTQQAVNIPVAVIYGEHRVGGNRINIFTKNEIQSLYGWQTSTVIVISNSSYVNIFRTQVSCAGIQFRLLSKRIELQYSAGDGVRTARGCFRDCVGVANTGGEQYARYIISYKNIADSTWIVQHTVFKEGLFVLTGLSYNQWDIKIELDVDNISGFTSTEQYYNTTPSTPDLKFLTTAGGGTQSLDKNSQFLSILLGMGEGEIEDVSEFEIGGNPLHNYTIDGAKIDFSVRKGLNIQESITGFEDLHSLQRPTGSGAIILLKDASFTYSTSKAITAFELNFRWSSFYYTNDRGESGAHRATYRVEYQIGKTGSFIDLGLFNVHEFKFTAVRKIFGKDGLSLAEYNIRITKTSNNSGPVGGGNILSADMYLDYVDETLSDDLTYPNTALVGLKFLATKHLSGIAPNTTALVRGRKVLQPQLIGESSPVSSTATQVIRYVDTGAVAGGDGTTAALTSGNGTHAYAGLQIAETAEAGNISAATGSNEYFEFRCAASTGVADGPVSFSGWITQSPDNSITVYATDFPVDGIVDWTKYHLHNDNTTQNTLNIGETNMFFKDLQLRVTGGTAERYGFYSASGEVYELRRCIVVGEGMSGCTGARGISNGSGSQNIMNCTITGFINGVDRDFYGIYDNTGQLNIHNTVVWNCYRGITHNFTGGPTEAFNCAVGNCIDDFRTVTAISCISDDGDGSDSIGPKNGGGDWSGDFVDPDNGNFTPVAGGNILVAGLNDPGSGLFLTDIIRALYVIDSWSRGAYSSDLPLSPSVIHYDEYYHDGTDYRKYDGSLVTWDGSTWVTQWSANPVWIFYDLIITNRFGLGRWISSSAFTESFLIEMANYCDEMVPAGLAQGVTEKRFRLDIVIDTERRALDLLEMLLTTFRGIYTYAGGKIKLRIDKPEVSSQLFTMGNIVEGSFTEAFKSIKDSPNVIRVNYLDEDKRHQQDSAEVTDSDAIADGKVFSNVELSLFGITRVSHVVREARYVQRISKHIVRSIGFKAVTDAIACQGGDIIDFSHDVPQWGFSGRILNQSASRSVTFDQSVTLAADTTYLLRVRHRNDTLATRRVLSDIVSRILSQVTSDQMRAVSSGSNILDSDVQDYDLFAIGTLTTVTKPFKIVSLKKDNSQVRSIAAVEYDPVVYGNPWFTKPQSNFLMLDLSIPAVTNIVAIERVVVLSDGTIASDVIISWQIPELTAGFIHSYASAKIYISYDGGTSWNLIGSSDTTTFTYRVGIDEDGATAFSFKVVTVTDIGEEGSLETASSVTITVLGKTAAPEDVTGFAVSQDNGVLTFTWNAVSDLDLSGYQIKQGSIWVDSITIVEHVAGTQVSVSTTAVGSTWFWIIAIDTSGNESVNPTNVILAVLPGGDGALYAFDFWQQDLNYVHSPNFAIEYANYYDEDYVRSVLTLNTKTTWEDLEAMDLGWNEHLENGSLFLGSDVVASEEFITMLNPIDFVSAFSFQVTQSLSSRNVSGGSTTLQISTSNNNANYTPFVDVGAGLYIARYVKYRLQLLTTVPANDIRVYDLIITHTAPDMLSAIGRNIAVDNVSGVTIFFGVAFTEAPFITPIIVSGGPGVVSLSSTTASSFVVTVYDMDGVAIDTAVIDYTAEGV